jgi:hypothetical protein
LIHQLTPVDKDQRADASTCNKACSNYRFSEGGWSAKYALVVSKQLSDRFVLFSSQFSTKRNINVLPCGSFILNLDPDSVPLEQAEQVGRSVQRKFFEYPGPLYSVTISPAAATLAVNQTRRFRALPRDPARRRVENELVFAWEITEGGGALSSFSDQEVEFQASTSPGLTRLSVAVSQHDVRSSAEALITVVDELGAEIGVSTVNARGLPAYTFERAAGELWRSGFDVERNLIVVNSGHRDFVFATRSRALQLRYLLRLYVKELVLRNFIGVPPEQLAERMIELSLYVEEKLKLP